jgi:arginine decarboxylase-like protein
MLHGLVSSFVLHQNKAQRKTFIVFFLTGAYHSAMISEINEQGYQ